MVPWRCGLFSDQTGSITISHNASEHSNPGVFLHAGLECYCCATAANLIITLLDHENEYIDSVPREPACVPWIAGAVKAQ